MIKCFICETKAGHSFSECLSISCNCTCVSQIYKMRTNKREDDIKPVHPKFLSINPLEVKELPNQDLAIKEYNRIDRREWLPKKKDKRFKVKRKR